MRRRVLQSSAFVASLFLLVVPTALAQGNPRIGLGVSTSDFTEVWVAGMSENTPASALMPTIFVPINLSSRFRVEPEIGFQWASSKNASSYTNSTSAVHVGAGVFSLASKDRFTVYYGARVAYLRFTHASESPSGTNSLTYPAANGYFIAPAVGGEYFLSDHVSIGAEIAVRYAHQTFKASSGTGTITANNANTHGGITVRFWIK